MEKDSTWDSWLCEAVNKIRGQKQRPDIDRIYNAVRQLAEKDEIALQTQKSHIEPIYRITIPQPELQVVEDQLERAVSTKLLQRIVNKGLVSYKCSKGSERVLDFTDFSKNQNASEICMFKCIIKIMRELSESYLNSTYPIASMNSITGLTVSQMVDYIVNSHTIKYTENISDEMGFLERILRAGLERDEAQGQIEQIGTDTFKFNPSKSIPFPNPSKKEAKKESANSKMAIKRQASEESPEIEEEEFEDDALEDLSSVLPPSSKNARIGDPDFNNTSPQSPSNPEVPEEVSFVAPQEMEEYQSSMPQWEVEGIEGMRVVEGSVEFFLKWKGYKREENTWEPSENLNCPELINGFMERFRLEDDPKINIFKTTKAGKLRKIREITLEEFEAGEEIETPVLPEESAPEKEVLADFPLPIKGVHSMPEEILAATKFSDQTIFLVKWVEDVAEFVLASEMKSKYPEIVIRFYEKCVDWKDP